MLAQRPEGTPSPSKPLPGGHTGCPHLLPPPALHRSPDRCSGRWPEAVLRVPPPLRSLGGAPSDSCPLPSSIQETAIPATKALSSTLLRWMPQAAHPQRWPPLPPARASLSSLRPPRPRALGAATWLASRRRPPGPAARATPSACWTRSCSAWVRPRGLPWAGRPEGTLGAE